MIDVKLGISASLSVLTLTAKAAVEAGMAPHFVVIFVWKIPEYAVLLHSRAAQFDL